MSCTPHLQAYNMLNGELIYRPDCSRGSTKWVDMNKLVSESSMSSAVWGWGHVVGLVLGGMLSVLGVLSHKTRLTTYPHPRVS